MRNPTRSPYTGLLLGGALLLSGAMTGGAAAASRTAVDKLGRGVAGMVGGVLELPGNMVEAHDEDGAAGLPLGFAKGVGMVMVREIVGVYEFVTAPLPVPAGYKPVLEPEYPWSYFDEARPRSTARASR